MEKDTSKIDDGQLLSQCLAGDRQAAGEFVQRFSNLVYGTIRRTLIVRHIKFCTDDIADLHNTVFLLLFENKCKKLRQFKGKNKCSIATWVRTITVRIILNHIRKKGINGMAERDRLAPIDQMPELWDNRKSPLEMLEDSQREEMFRNGIESLPPRDRIFLKLHFYKWLSLPEVAETMGITVQNAYTVKHRIIHKLKSFIASEMKEN